MTYTFLDDDRYSAQHSGNKHGQRHYDDGQAHEAYDGWAFSEPAHRSSRRDESSNNNTHRYTYGTYIWPIVPRSYPAPDPTRCTCSCCPHPYQVNGQSAPLWSADTRTYRDLYQEPTSKDTSRPTYHKSHSSRNNKKTEPRYRKMFKVVYNVGGDGHARFARDYTISVEKQSTVRDILSCLDPDIRNAVLVHWDDGEVETLDSHVPMDELRKYADFLEIRQKKPRKKVKHVKFKGVDEVYRI